MMDWNARYENEDTPWDKGAPAPILKSLLSDGVFPTNAEVLVPGCGYGHDAREIAAAGYSATGMDISELALDKARAMTDVDSITGEVSWELEDIFSAELPQKKRYDVIWEHTCYCAIPPEMRESFINAAYDLLKEEGLFIGVFFTAPQTKPGPPHMTGREDLLEMLSQKFTLIWEREPKSYYPGREGKEWLMCWRRS